MSSSLPSARLAEADYDVIEEAVMETARGRWFLSEYARRYRATDTASVLEALNRLEEMAAPLEGPAFESEQIAAVLTAIEQAQTTPWQGISDGDDRPPQLRPTQTSKSAAAAVRSTAEKILEVSFELRETTKLEIYANALDLYCADLANAVSLQESATSRLAELSGLLVTIKSKLLDSPAGSISDPAGPAKAETGAVSGSASIAPTELLESPPAPTAAMAPEDGEVRSSIATRKIVSEKDRASALMFVNPS